jgi:hypothetical protein
MVHLLGVRNLSEAGYSDKFLDGDTSAIELVDKAIDPPSLLLAYPKHQYNMGRPVRPENVPTVLHWKQPRWALADICKPSGFPCVSERFKALIEDLEPGVHQFFPLELVNGKREHLADRWLWVVCQRIDSVDREHSNLVLRRGALWLAPSEVPEGELPPNIDPSLAAKVVFNSAQVGGAHFWRDKFSRPSLLFCSDKAAAAIEEQEMTGAKLLEKETV